MCSEISVSLAKKHFLYEIDFFQNEVMIIMMLKEPKMMMMMMRRY